MKITYSNIAPEIRKSLEGEFVHHIEKLNRLIAAGPFEVHVAQTFPLERATDAQRALETHYLGKLALRPN